MRLKLINKLSGVKLFGNQLIAEADILDARRPELIQTFYVEHVVKRGRESGSDSKADDN